MSKKILVLFILCVVIAAFSGCTTSEQTAAEVTEEKEVIITVTEFNPTIESAVLLGQEHAKTMEAIEEAFAYIISGSVEEKDDFYSLMQKVESIDSEFIILAGFDTSAEGKNFFEDHSAIVDAREKMVSSAKAMFDEYEGSSSVSQETFAEYESAIDDLTSLFGPFTVAYFDAVSEEEYGSSIYAKPATDLLKMHRDMLEAVEESFGYIVLGEEEEKNDYYTTMHNFRTAADEFETSFLKEYPDEKEITEAYNKVMSSADTYEKAAEVVFESYEKNGEITSEEYETYETSIDELTTAFDSLMDIVLEKL